MAKRKLKAWTRDMTKWADRAHKSIRLLEKEVYRLRQCCDEPSQPRLRRMDPGKPPPPPDEIW